MTDSSRAMNPVGWFEIYVQDMDRARAFYETVLQYKLEKLETPDSFEDLSMWAFPALPENSGAAGSLVKMKGVESGGNNVLIYFSCQDCAVEASRIKAAGGRIDREKASIGSYGFIVIAADTEGNSFGLHSMK